jgi:DMSO/TMAO reductase YedYZ molybdopterin-dependent catalytic subunit
VETDTMTEHTAVRRTTGDSERRDGEPEDGEQRGSERTIEVVGERTVSIALPTVPGLPHVERECTIVCASGDRTTARWWGVEVLPLLDRADAPVETTHLRVHSDDGYCACVALRNATTALLAVERDGQSLDEVDAYATRLVGPSISGERAVKGVTRIEAVVLDPGDDPTDRERLSLDDPAYG